MRAAVARVLWKEAAHGTDVSAYVEVLKIRIALVTALSAVAGLMAGEVLPGPGRVVAVALAVLLAAMGAGALNHALEPDLDTRMERTRARPLPTGRIARRGRVSALGSALLLAGAGLGAAALGPATGAYTFLGALTYVVIYTIWLKRRTWLNVVIGGLAGSFAVLAGAAANEGGVSAAAWQLALILFFWSPSHFWNLAVAYRDDYERGGVPMLPVVVDAPTAAGAILLSDVLLAAATFLPAVTGTLGHFYLAGAAGACAWLLAPGLRLLRRPGNAHEALAGFKGSMFYLAVLFSAVFIDRGLGGAF